MRQSDEALALMNAAMVILDAYAPNAAACHLQNAIDIVREAADGHGNRDGDGDRESAVVEPRFGGWVRLQRTG